MRKNRGAQHIEGTSELAQLNTGKFLDINVRHRQALPDDSYCISDPKKLLPVVDHR
jgi:hypothetical protein